MLATTALLPLAACSTKADKITLYRDPTCECCTEWREQVEAELQRTFTAVDQEDRSTLHQRLGIPDELKSCHTAIIDGMAFEGHVPVEDIKLALIMRPAGVRGLAVPGMPIGSPGMESDVQPTEPYVVMTFGASPSKPFSRH